jgi:hypothetical protein
VKRSETPGIGHAFGQALKERRSRLWKWHPAHSSAAPSELGRFLSVPWVPLRFTQADILLTLRVSIRLIFAPF